jgi:hypothetical protein
VYKILKKRNKRLPALKALETLGLRRPSMCV